jgi:hypothetical protein
MNILFKGSGRALLAIVTLTLPPAVYGPWLIGQELTLSQEEPHHQIDTTVETDLSSVWHRVRMSIPVERSNSPTKVDRQALDGFLAYAEQRLRTKLPGWWVSVIRSTRALSPEQVWFYPADGYPKRTLGFRTAPDVNLTKPWFSQHATLQVSGESVWLPSILVERRRACTNPCVSACANNGRMYIAFHSSLLDEYLLDAYDCRSRRKLWESGVLRRIPSLTYDGVVSDQAHVVSISVTNQAVFVFGATGICVYVEGFRPEDGHSLFRWRIGHPVFWFP